MRFTETILPGVFVVEPERLVDDRGFFARTWCRDEFARRGLVTDWAQCSVSYNAKCGTLRGMHWQAAPFEEVKLVRCTTGAAIDVVLDVQPDSATFRRWIGVEITAENRLAVYIPRGFAHGFQTLTDGTELFYQISAPHHAESARGARWNDPAFGISWPPFNARVISPRDSAYPDFPI